MRCREADDGADHLFALGAIWFPSSAAVSTRAKSSPTCSPLLYAKLRASSDMVIQSMPAAGHSLPRATSGVATLAAVAVTKARRLIIAMTNLPDLAKLVTIERRRSLRKHVLLAAVRQGIRALA